MAFAPPEVPLQRDILEGSCPSEWSLSDAPSQIQELMPDSPMALTRSAYKPAPLLGAADEPTSNPLLHTDSSRLGHTEAFICHPG